MTAIQEAKNLTKMGLDELLRSLMTHDITLKSNKKNDESKKKREIVFKTSSDKIKKKSNMMKIVMRKYLYSQEDLIKCSKETNFLEGKEEGTLAKKKNQRKIPSFILSAKSRGK